MRKAAFIPSVLMLPLLAQSALADLAPPAKPPAGASDPSVVELDPGTPCDPPSTQTRYQFDFRGQIRVRDIATFLAVLTCRKIALPSAIAEVGLGFFAVDPLTRSESAALVHFALDGLGLRIMKEGASDRIARAPGPPRARDLSVAAHLSKPRLGSAKQRLTGMNVIALQTRPNGFLLVGDRSDRTPAIARALGVSLESKPPLADASVDLASEAPARAIECQDDLCHTSTAALDRILSNVALLAIGARFVPNVRNGRSGGFKVYAIRRSSVFDQLGLKDGDVVKAINGLPCNSTDDLLGHYSQLRNAHRVTFLLERTGQEKQIILEIK